MVSGVAFSTIQSKKLYWRHCQPAKKDRRITLCSFRRFSKPFLTGKGRFSLTSLNEGEARDVILSFIHEDLGKKYAKVDDDLTTSRVIHQTLVVLPGNCLGPCLFLIFASVRPAALKQANSSVHVLLYAEDFTKLSTNRLELQNAIVGLMI